MKKKKKFSRKKVINIAAVAMLIAAAVLVVLLALLRVDPLKSWYADMQEWLIDFENRVTSIENKHVVFLVILTLFCIKGFVPFLPISTLCFMTGMVFPGFSAFLINMLGAALQMSIAYFKGRLFGGGNVHKFLNKYDGTRQLLEKKASAHTLLLLAFRLVPFAPMNTVSLLFGSLDVTYWEYIFISIGGFSPKIVSYTIIGRNVYDPLSPSFIVPIIVLLLISALSALILNFALDRVSKNSKAKEKTGEKA